MLCGVAWGGGETPALAGIVESGRIDLAASCTGLINPKERLSVGDKLGPGDAIVLLASSGIHANGLSLARKLVERLPQGYLTPVATGPRPTARRCSRRHCCTRRSPKRCTKTASRRTTAPTSPAMAGASCCVTRRVHVPHSHAAGGSAGAEVHPAARAARRPRGLQHVQHGRRLCAVRRRAARRSHASPWRAIKAWPRSSPAMSRQARRRSSSSRWASSSATTRCGCAEPPPPRARQRSRAKVHDPTPTIVGDGPPRMEARPTGSGRERSSPNRCDQCRGKARHLTLSAFEAAHERSPPETRIALCQGRFQWPAGTPCAVQQTTGTRHSEGTLLTYKA